MQKKAKNILIMFLIVPLVFLLGGNAYADEGSEATGKEETEAIQEYQPSAEQEPGIPEGQEFKEITVTGTINDYYQVETAQGDLYEIAESEVGDEMGRNAGRKVKVKGWVYEADGYKILSVESYQFTEE